MRRRIVLSALAAIACGILGAAAAAQGTREPDVLSALLMEVRGLRQAMEQMASAGPRVQLALGRLQLQEARVNTMLRRLEGVRDSVAGAERGVSQALTDVARGQEAVRTAEAEGNADQARQFALDLVEVKRRVAFVQQELQRLQAEEAQLQQQIAAEQGRWAEINRTLEDLERSLKR